MEHRWRRLRAHSIAALCGALMLNFVAGAQTNSATLSGTVRDSQGAVVPDAAITVSSPATGLKREVMSNSEGLFTVPVLPPGTYSLRAQREGFSVVEIEDIELPVAGVVSRDVLLTVGGTRETVNVSAAPPLLQPDTSALAEVVNNSQVESLPINGRDYRRLTILLPGAAPRSQRGSLGSFTVNGQREKANIF
jgi:Carboxypeptidase regulatory-like domain